MLRPSIRPLSAFKMPSMCAKRPKDETIEIELYGRKFPGSIRETNEGFEVSTRGMCVVGTCREHAIYNAGYAILCLIHAESKKQS